MSVRTFLAFVVTVTLVPLASSHHEPTEIGPTPFVVELEYGDLWFDGATGSLEAYAHALHFPSFNSPGASDEARLVAHFQYESTIPTDRIEFSLQVRVNEATASAVGGGLGVDAGWSFANAMAWMETRSQGEPVVASDRETIVSAAGTGNATDAFAGDLVLHTEVGRSFGPRVFASEFGFHLGASAHCSGGGAFTLLGVCRGPASANATLLIDSIDVVVRVYPTHPNRVTVTTCEVLNVAAGLPRIPVEVDNAGYNPDAYDFEATGAPPGVWVKPQEDPGTLQPGTHRIWLELRGVRAHDEFTMALTATSRTDPDAIGTAQVTVRENDDGPRCDL